MDLGANKQRNTPLISGPLSNRLIDAKQSRTPGRSILRSSSCCALSSRVSFICTLDTANKCIAWVSKTKEVEAANELGGGRETLIDRHSVLRDQGHLTA